MLPTSIDVVVEFGVHIGPTFGRSAGFRKAAAAAIDDNNDGNDDDDDFGNDDDDYDDDDGDNYLRMLSIQV